MARQNPLKKVTQEDFNQLFAAHANGARLYFKDCDLNGLDLSDKKLDSIVFEDCNLNDVNFSGASIEKGEFKNCLLIGVNLAKADLVSVEFAGCAMQKVNLSQVRIEGVGITESNLAYASLKRSEVEFSDSNVFREVNLHGADLSETNLGWFVGEKINFEDANLSCASISESRFQGCNFSNALLNHAQLYSVAFDDCKLKKSVLATANITNVTFNGSEMQDADFSKAEIGYGSFVDTNLDGALFQDVALHSANQFKNVSLVGADFTDAVFSGEAMLHEVDLRQAKGLNAELRKLALPEMAKELQLPNMPQLDAEKEYRHQLTLFSARYMGSEVNTDADVRIAQLVLDKGCAPAELVQAIATHSPNPLRRGEDYATAVVRRAQRELTPKR